MTIEARIVKDSITQSGVRLTTFVLKYPRFIHSEFMTHRLFSRNASSSRAIPVERQIRDIRDDIARPLEFRKNQKGMQAGEAYGPFGQKVCNALWTISAYLMIFMAKLFIRLGVHKQYANRLLEPFSHITVIVSATSYSNFFALRYHSAAQPEIAKLAETMWQRYELASPTFIGAGDWHLPFVDVYTEYDTVRDMGFNHPLNNHDMHLLQQALIKRSVARCARVSYLNHDGTKPSLQQDLNLHDRLLSEQPIHASPAEHQAMGSVNDYTKSGNFHGWVQYRKTIPGEVVTTFEGPLG